MTKLTLNNPHDALNKVQLKKTFPRMNHRSNHLSLGMFTALWRHLLNDKILFPGIHRETAMQIYTIEMGSRLITPRLMTPRKLIQSVGADNCHESNLSAIL